MTDANVINRQRLLILHVALAFLHAVSGVGGMALFIFLFLELRGQIFHGMENVPFFIALGILPLLLVQNSFFRRGIEVIKVEGDSTAWVGRKSTFQVPLSDVQIFHVTEIFWGKIFLGKGVQMAFVRYQSWGQSIPRSRSLGIRSKEELKELKAQLEARVPIHLSKNYFY